MIFMKWLMKCIYLAVFYLTLPIRSSLRFSVLLKDTLTSGREELGIKLPTLQLIDDLLYLLRHSRPIID